MQFKCPCRSLCVLLFTWLSLAGSAMAVNETFSYSDGALENQGIVGEWTGPWAAGSQSVPPTGSTPWQVASGAVEVQPINPTIAYGYEDSDVQRELSAPAVGASIYMSFLITPGDMGASYDPNLFTDGSTGIVVGFADGLSNTGSNGQSWSPNLGQPVKVGWSADLKGLT